MSQFYEKQYDFILGSWKSGVSIISTKTKINSLKKFQCRFTLPSFIEVQQVILLMDYT
jgi:hypothetical protein